MTNLILIFLGLFLHVSALGQSRLDDLIRRNGLLPKVVGEEVRQKSTAFQDLDILLRDISTEAKRLGVPLSTDARDQFIALGDTARKKGGFGNIVLADMAYRIALRSEIYLMSRSLKVGTAAPLLIKPAVLLDRQTVFNLLADEYGEKWALDLEHSCCPDDGALVFRVADALDTNAFQRKQALKKRPRGLLVERLWVPLLLRFMETTIIGQSLVPAVAEYIKNGGTVAELGTDAFNKRIDINADKFLCPLGGGRFVYSSTLDKIILHPQEIDADGIWFE